MKIKLIKIGNKGMTLVELITASSIAILIMGTLSVLIGKSIFVNRYVIEQGLNTSSLQSAIKAFSVDMREARQSDSGGYLIEQASDFEITFYADVDDDGATERVHYFLDGFNLKRGVTEGGGFPLVYPSGDQQTKIVGRGVVNGASRPLFYYYNRNYPQDVTNNPLHPPIQIDQIGMVKIDLHANIDPEHIPNSMHMETFIHPRNIK